MASSGRILRGEDWAVALRNCLAEGPVDMCAWMERHTLLLKSDAYSRVGLLPVWDQPCFLKFYLAKSPWQRLHFQLGHGRGIRSFDAANQLRQRGLSVPTPRACLLVPGGVALLTEGIADSRDLRALWLEQPGSEQADQLMQSAAETLAALHLEHFSHGDCKWSNLLWNGERFYLVDLEAVRPVKPGRSEFPQLHARQLRDLARFTVDAEELGLGAYCYGVFLRHYCAASGYDRAGLVAAIRPAVESIRQRHKQASARDYEPLL